MNRALSASIQLFCQSHLYPLFFSMLCIHTFSFFFVLLVRDQQFKQLRKMLQKAEDRTAQVTSTFLTSFSALRTLQINCIEKNSLACRHIALNCSLFGNFVRCSLKKCSIRLFFIRNKERKFANHFGDFV